MKSVFCCLLLFSFAEAAIAANHVTCVDSSAALATALSSLSTASVNDDSDEIRIRTGTYHAPAGGWIGAVTTRHDLTVRGGYTDAGCTHQTLDAASTILDGNNTSGVLTIDTPLIPDSDIEVSGLTFQNGHGGNTFESNAGGLKIGDPNPISGGKILVERNIFRDNVATGNGFSQAIGGLLAATDGASLVVRGNLFVNNSSPNAPALSVYSNNAIDVANNTFSGNHATDAAQAKRVTLDYITFAGVRLSNNIFWGNVGGAGSFDLDLAGSLPGTAGATLTNNDIEASTGTAVAATGTLHVDPQFIGGGNFRLSHTSPLIDAGVGNPTGGLTNVDLDGGARVAGAAVDLGAYESADVSAGPPIGGGISGNWFDPSTNQGGHGFQIEVLPNNGMLVIWFVFNPAGTAQNWIYMQGGYGNGSNTVTLPAFLEQGGRFPPNFDSRNVAATPWGSLTLTFADCDNGTAVWAPNAQAAAAGYAAVTFPVRRLTSLAGTTCP
jgi:hypothetical protein